MYLNMIMPSSHILLSQKSITKNPLVNVAGDKIPAAAQIKSDNHTQTFVWNVSRFAGTLKLQATLLMNPSETDWVDLKVITGTNLSEVNFHNVTGNFVWVRAIIAEMTAGTISNVSVSY